MHASVVPPPRRVGGDVQRCVSLHRDDGCLTPVLLDPAQRVVAAFGDVEGAVAEATRRGAGWSAAATCFDELSDAERWLIGGCHACRHGPCALALVPGEAFPCGCGCHGPDPATVGCNASGGEAFPPR